MIKSAILQRIDVESDDGKLFVRAIETCAVLSDDVLLSLAKSIPIVIKVSTSRELDDLILAQTTKLGITRVQAGRAIDHLMLPIVTGFAGQRSEQERQDSPELLAEELVSTLRLVSSENRLKFERLFVFLKEVVAPIVEKQEIIKRAAVGVLPSFKGFGATVEIRAALSSNFHFGDSSDQYEPRIGDLVPIASIALRVTRSEQENFFFQVDEKELITLIESLKATLKEMKTLADHVTLTSVK